AYVPSGLELWNEPPGYGSDTVALGVCPAQKSKIGIDGPAVAATARIAPALAATAQASRRRRMWVMACMMSSLVVIGRRADRLVVRSPFGDTDRPYGPACPCTSATARIRFSAAVDLPRPENQRSRRPRTSTLRGERVRRYRTPTRSWAANQR